MNSTQKNCEASKGSDRKVLDGSENLYNSTPLDYLRNPDTCPDPQDKILISLEEKKRKYHKLTRQKKLEKLGMHSLCKLNECKCKGWRTPNRQRMSSTKEFAKGKCEICQHTLLNHYSHVQNHPENFIDYLLNFVVELKSINALCYTEEDESTLDAYTVLGKTLQNSIGNLIKPDVAEIICRPPFEKTTIAQTMRSFILCKYSNFNEKELHDVIICAQIVLHYINSLILIKVDKWKIYFPECKIESYEINYIRWLCYCNFPKTYRSFEHFDMVDTLGPRFLKVIYEYFQKTTYYKIKDEIKNKQVKDCVLSLIDAFGKELENESSSVWSPFYLPVGKHLVPDYIIAKSYKALCPHLASNDVTTYTIKEVYSSNFSPGSLPPSEDLPNDVPEDMVKDAIRSLKAFAEINHQNSPAQEERKTRKVHSSIEVNFVSNSVSPKMSAESMQYLTGLTAIFVHLLPKIPEELIIRYVFDTKHRCLVLTQQKQVVGGICFRMFPEQNFSEIVFLGILHVKGYGAFMMNHLKDYHLKHNIHYFLSYVNYGTILFFEKQGFTTKPSLDKNLFDRYIKEYAGATLMECKLDPEIRYTALSKVIEVQMHIVKQLVKRRCTSYHKSLPVPIGSESKFIPVEHIKRIKREI